jgi:hypothetical protein
MKGKGVVVDLQLHMFFLLALEVGEWSVLGSGRFNPRKQPLVQKEYEAEGVPVPG